MFLHFAFYTVTENCIFLLFPMADVMNLGLQRKCTNNSNMAQQISNASSGRLPLHHSGQLHNSGQLPLTMNAQPSTDAPNEDTEPVKRVSPIKKVFKGSFSLLAAAVPRPLVTPIISLLFTALLFAVVGPVFSAYESEGSQQQNTATVYCAINQTGNNPNQGAKDCWEYQQAITVLGMSKDGAKDVSVSRNLSKAVLLSTRINTLDLQASTASLIADLHFFGDLYADRKRLNLTANQSLVIFGNTNNLTVQGGTRAPKFSFDIKLDVQTPLFNYPFDHYSALLSVSAYIVNNETNIDEAVPLIHELRTNLPAFHLDVSQAKDNVTVFQNANLSEAVTLVKIKRSNTTRFFSLFVVISMWALSAATFVFVLDLVYMKPRPVKTDDAAYVAALMFALPGVRVVQPNVPEVGASVDVLGFYWNMVITALAGMLILGGLIGQSVHKPTRLKAHKSTPRFKKVKSIRRNALAWLKRYRSAALKYVSATRRTFKSRLSQSHTQNDDIAAVAVGMAPSTVQKRASSTSGTSQGGYDTQQRFCKDAATVRDAGLMLMPGPGPRQSGSESGATAILRDLGVNRLTAGRPHTDLSNSEGSAVDLLPNQTSS